ncbi:MBL fold metallo-hydrolase [Pseudomonas sp. NPDC089534]|uniref:MBL fold metallo-hydrolase n=1 Tax=Pseudomonas sp. NPDC089534 TaxID=3364468 RepID=UPI00381A802E
MKQIYPDLWQTTPEHPFLGVTSHAYLLTTNSGNILFYSSGTLEYRAIDALGGVRFQFLSHRDEAGPELHKIKKHFRSHTLCHRLEAPSVGKYTSVDEVFDQAEVRLGNIEVIPTPGHTNGSVCFFVRSPHGKNYLLTGDTLYMSNGAWESRINRGDGGSKADLIESLKRLQTLSPDVVISSASVGHAPFKEVTATEWRSITYGVIKSLS